MTFKELISKNKWEDVKEALLKLYPEQDELIDAYEDVYNDLSNIEAVESRFLIDIDLNKDEDYPEEEYEVNCMTGEASEENGEEEWTDIEIESWENSLGMQISKKTTAEFSELEIIAHCLNQMTMLGFTEEDIQLEMQEQMAILDEFEKLSPEEQMKLLAQQHDWDDEEE